MLSQGKGRELLSCGGVGVVRDALSESESGVEHGNIMFFVYLV